MLLTITTSYRPATDLGYLLHKRPDRTQSFALAFGEAHVCYPEATEERCTAALILDVDALGLVRGRDESLADYVSDRPFVASSFMSVALNHVFRSAMAGRCEERPELAGTPIPLEARLSVVQSFGGPELIERLFAPLGYAVTTADHTLDERFPDWGASAYYTFTLRANCRLADLLTHLYVLIPVLDRLKHYYVGEDELEKLLRHGGSWLAGHPERELIVSRYLRHKRRLIDSARARLLEETTEEAGDDQVEDRLRARLERDQSLAEQRLHAVLAVLKGCGAQRVLDLGCGEGRLLKLLLDDHSFTEIVGADVSFRAVERASERLHLDRLPERQRARIRMLHSSLVYRDPRLAGFDAAALVEVIEHLDPPRLAAFEQAVFVHARPGTVVLTTPNAEYNALFDDLHAGEFRHHDHRFEWTRAQFRAWAEPVAQRHGYALRLLPIGTEHPQHGSPTQMAVFSLGANAA